MHTNSCSAKNCENESEALEGMKDLNNYVEIWETVSRHIIAEI